MVLPKVLIVYWKKKEANKHIKQIQLTKFLLNQFAFIVKVAYEITPS